MWLINNRPGVYHKRYLSIFKVIEIGVERSGFFVGTKGPIGSEMSHFEEKVHLKNVAQKKCQ